MAGRRGMDPHLQRMLQQFFDKHEEQPSSQTLPSSRPAIGQWQQTGHKAIAMRSGPLPRLPPRLDVRGADLDPVPLPSRPPSATVSAVHFDMVQPLASPTMSNVGDAAVALDQAAIDAEASAAPTPHRVTPAPVSMTAARQPPATSPLGAPSNSMLVTLKRARGQALGLELHEDDAGGWTIRAMKPGSISESSGLLASGDRILTIDGHAVNSMMHPAHVITADMTKVPLCIVRAPATAALTAAAATNGASAVSVSPTERLAALNAAVPIPIPAKEVPNGLPNGRPNGTSAHISAPAPAKKASSTTGGMARLTPAPARPTAGGGGAGGGGSGGPRPGMLSRMATSIRIIPAKKRETDDIDDPGVHLSLARQLQIEPPVLSTWAIIKFATLQVLKYGKRDAYICLACVAVLCSLVLVTPLLQRSLLRGVEVAYSSSIADVPFVPPIDWLTWLPHGEWASMSAFFWYALFISALQVRNLPVAPPLHVLRSPSLAVPSSSRPARLW